MNVVANVAGLEFRLGVQVKVVYVSKHRNGDRDVT